MQEQIVDIIRNRVRHMSSTFLKYSDLSPTELAGIISIQRTWRRYVFRKKLQKAVKRRTSRKYVLAELISTEREYIKDMRVVIEQVMLPLREKKDEIDEEFLKMLFMNIEEIVPIHEDMLAKLEDTLKDFRRYTTKVSLPILEFAPKIKSPYYLFCLQYKKSIQILRLLKNSNSTFKSHLLKLQKQGILKFQLTSYMIKPIQRLCKYKLLLAELVKYTDPDHPDLSDLQKAHQMVLLMVKQTNDQIEEFIMQEKLEGLDKKYGGGLLTEKRRLVKEFRVDVVEREGVKEAEFYLMSDLILVVEGQDVTRWVLDENTRVKVAPDAKYFKNIVSVTNPDKTLKMSMKTPAKKLEIYNAVKACLVPFEKGESSRRVDVDVEGTQERGDSFFKKYTVYIIKINDSNQEFKIYPRFNELIEIQEQIQKLIPDLKLPQLQKDSYLSTRKTKTIQKRKFVIQQFLITLLNQPRVRNFPQIYKSLNLQCLLCDSPRMTRKSSSTQSESIVCLQVLVANSQPISCWISSKAHVFDLKQQISEMLCLHFAEEYELFECRDKVVKLIYEEELISKFKTDKKSMLMALFQEKVSLIYTRYFYRQEDEEQKYYQADPNRLLFQLAIIRSELASYNLQIQLKMTVLALFAKQSSLDYTSQPLLKQFLDGFPNLPHPNLPLLQAYCQQMDQVVQKQSLTIPQVIIKVLSQCDLYKSRQFPVTIYQKCNIKKEIAGMEEEMVLAVKRDRMMLLTKKKVLILAVDYRRVKEMSVYATSVVFAVEGLGSQLRLDTSQSFEISKLIEKYSKQIVANQLE